MKKRAPWFGLAGLFSLLVIAHPGSVDASSGTEDGARGPVTCNAYWEGWYFAEGKGCSFGSASGCSNPFPYSSEEECRAGNAEPMPIVSPCDPGLPMDPYTVLDADVEQDTLRMRVEYGGGCTEHLFTLCWDGAFAESHPVQARLMLQHDAQDDRCLAIVTEDLAFDLSSVKERYQDAYDRKSGVIQLGISGHDPRVRYSF